MTDKLKNPTSNDTLNFAFLALEPELLKVMHFKMMLLIV